MAIFSLSFLGHMLALPAPDAAAVLGEGDDDGTATRSAAEGDQRFTQDESEKIG
jgi:hypothetical protein